MLSNWSLTCSRSNLLSPSITSMFLPISWMILCYSLGQNSSFPVFEGTRGRLVVLVQLGLGSTTLRVRVVSIQGSTFTLGPSRPSLSFNLLHSSCATGVPPWSCQSPRYWCAQGAGYRSTGWAKDWLETFSSKEGLSAQWFFRSPSTLWGCLQGAY